jgi:hypothetical protein
MQASFMLLCGNDETLQITKSDCISAALSSASSRFLSQYAKVRANDHPRPVSSAQSPTESSYTFLTIT